MPNFKKDWPQLEREIWNRFFDATGNVSSLDYEDAVRVFEYTLTVDERMALDSVRRKLLTFPWMEV